MFHKLTCWLFACLYIMVCTSPSYAIDKVPPQQSPRVTNSLLLQNILESPFSNGNIVPVQNRPYDTNKLLLQKENIVNVPDDTSSSFDSNIAPVQNRATDKLILQNTITADVSKTIFGVRSKRGIVLIDEDFDVPPGPGVKQGWNDGDHGPDRMEINGTTMEDLGSGSREMTSEDSISAKTPRFATPGNLQMSSSHDHSSTFDEEYADVEGSADEPSSTTISIVSETGMEDKDMKMSTPASLEESKVNLTTSVSPTPRVSTSTEASKDNLTTDVSSTTFISTSTETISNDVRELVTQLCINSTCNSKDLIILPIVSKTVPEGTNLTLSCTMSNTTDGYLKWYKYINESDHLMLEENNEGLGISFSIPKTKRHHSGRYVCLLSTEQSCCHKKLDIKVYEIPNYKQNFIIIGGVAAASLLVCILLGIHRSVKTKKFDEAIEYQNSVEKPFLL